MHEALAAADHDFVVTEPASKLDHLRTARRRGSRRTARRGRRYVSFLAAGFVVAAAAAILLNALVWQRARHPAPIFSRAAPAAPAKQPTTAGMIVVPPPRPQPASSPAQEHDPPLEKLPAQTWPVEKPPLDVPAGRQERQTHAASPARPQDKISQLLKASPAPPARSTPAAAAPAAPRKLVFWAQRALVKLGFVLNPDGVAGTATRQAIKRYERDHGFPERGELSAAIIRHLSAEAGIAIN